MSFWREFGKNCPRVVRAGKSATPRTRHALRTSIKPQQTSVWMLERVDAPTQTTRIRQAAP
jgi:hypothetical protein